MQLLGKYNSNISSYLYSRLLSLLQSSISAGGNGGVENVSQSDLAAIATQASAISSAPLPLAGQRTNDEQFNYPLNVLTAKYGSIQDELNQFIANSALLLSKLNLETELLDKLIAQAELIFWESQLLTSYGSTVISWDYNQGIGNLSTDFPVTDPVTGAIYTQNTNSKTIFNVTGGLKSGLLPPYTETIVEPTNITWSFDTTGQTQTIYSDSSAQLSILEDAIEINYSPNPNISVTLPIGGSIQNIFSISGDTSKGPINTYVRTGFYPRSATVQVVPNNAVDITFESWNYSVGGTSEPISGHITDGVLNANGTITCPNFKDGLGKDFLVSGNQTIYIETTLQGTLLGAPMNVFLDCLDSTGGIITSLTLPQPTANNSSYTWFQKISVPTNSSIKTARLRYETTDTSWLLANPRVHLPILLSNYEVVPDSVICYTINAAGDPSLVFDADSQFNVDENSFLTFFNMPDAQQVTLTFDEQFPYYQCSLNQTNWSPMIMLDESNPYPDDLPITHIVNIKNGQFPITNEEGSPTGLTMAMVGNPLFPYEFVVGVTASSSWGKTAVLEIDLSATKYVSQINIKPFSNFLPKLTQVALEGFGSNSQVVVFSGSQEISTETRIEFTRQVVGRIFLTFIQEGYTAKDHQIVDSNYVRRTVLEQVQNVVPTAAQRNIIANYKVQTGYQYDFGLSDIYAVDTTAGTGVTISGSYRFIGKPTVLSFARVSGGSVSSFVYYKVINNDGTVGLLSTTPIHVTNNSAFVIPYTGATAPNNIAYVDFSIKHVLHSVDAYLTRFSMQVNSNV